MKPRTFHARQMSVAALCALSCASFLGTLLRAQPPATGTACCGTITPAGAKFKVYLDSLHVEQLWPARVPIHWETGEPDPGRVGHEPPTHCSTFVAAAAKRLGIYILRPPEHSQEMLSLAQERWLEGGEAASQGWRRVASVREAQVLANRGEFVVLVFGQEHAAGHIAIVRPAVKTQAALDTEGPETTQASGRNFSDGTAIESFKLHRGAWPDQVEIFAHATSFEQSRP